MTDSQSPAPTNPREPHNTSAAELQDLRYEVFISYARADNRKPHGHPGWMEAFIQGLNRARREAEGPRNYKVYFDTTEIELMQDWKGHLQEGLEQSVVLTVMVSPRSLASEPCQWEWEQFQAWEANLGMARQLILPVYLEKDDRLRADTEAPEILDWLKSLPANHPAPRSEPAEYADRLARRLADLHQRQDMRDLQTSFQQEGEDFLDHPEVRETFRKIDKAIYRALEEARSRVDLTQTGLFPWMRQFVGREDEKKRLQETLRAGLSIVTAVQGLGGLGKTALINQLAREQARYYAGGIHLLGCDGIAQLEVVCAELMDHFGIDRRSLPTTAAQLNALVSALSRRHEETGARCLLIFDNVTEPQLLFQSTLRPFLNRNWLHLVATTRLTPQDLGEGDPSRKIIPLGELSETEAVELIRQFQPGEEFPSEGERQAAQGIARHLGGFTLAVEAAAIHIGLHETVTCRGFLLRLQQDTISAVDAATQEAEARMIHHTRFLEATLQPTLDGLDEIQLHILRLATLFPPDYILESWLRQLTALRFPDLADPEEEEARQLQQEMGLDEWGTALRRLKGLQLLSPRQTTSPDRRLSALRLHRLIGDLVRSTWSEEDQTEAEEGLITLLDQEGTLLEHRFDSDPRHAWIHPPLTLTTEHLALEPSTGHGAKRELRRPIRRSLATNLDIVSGVEARIGSLNRSLELVIVAERARRILYESNPNDSQAARDLSVSLDRLGDFYLRRGQSGDAEKALQSYQQSLDIAKALHESNPNDSQAARDLSVSLNKLGDFYLRRGQSGDAEKALQSYQQCHETLKALHESNPNDSQAARDLSVSLDRLGDFYLRRGQSGDAEKALQSYQQSLDIAKALHESNPNDSQATRDLSVSLNKLGDFYLRRGQSGDAEKALQSYQQSLEVRQSLHESNPNDSQAARDLSVSLERLAKVYFDSDQSRSGDLIQEAVTLRRILAQNTPSAEYLLELSRTLSQSIQILGATDQGAALQHLLECHQILKRLHEADSLFDPRDQAFFQRVDEVVNSLGGDQEASDDNPEGPEEKQDPPEP